MLSLFLLTCIFVISLALIPRVKSDALRFGALGVFCLLLIEGCVYLYFLFLIYQGTCFFLIGNQKGLDALIKTRLVYATYFAQGKKTMMNQLDNTLGYTIGQDKDTGPYQSNRQGFRADREYAFVPAGDVLRVAAFGDSFVFCDGETNQNTWAHFLEQSAGNMELLNFGVPGFGLGQSYLRYLKDGIRFHPDMVFFNYILTGPRDGVNPLDFVGFNNLRMAHFYRVNFRLENDVLLSESVTPYHLFDPAFQEKYLYGPTRFKVNPDFLSWKIFSLSNTGLLIKQAMIRKQLYAGTKDLGADGQRTPAEEAINLRILEHLLSLAKRNDSQILFFYRSGFETLPDSIQTLLNQNKDFVVYVDSETALADEFAKEGVKRDALMNDSNHFNPKGNQLYARAVLKILQSRVWGRGDRRFQYNEATHSFKNIGR